MSEERRYWKDMSDREIIAYIRDNYDNNFRVKENPTLWKVLETRGLLEDLVDLGTVEVPPVIILRFPKGKGGIELT